MPDSGEWRRYFEEVRGRAKESMHLEVDLQAWRDNIEAAWDRLDPRYDERFRRMWRYYLAGAMAIFRSRRAQVWQLVLSPNGVPGGYVAPR